MLFKKSKSRLIKVKEKAGFLEKEIQRFTEANLRDIFGLDFISSEFQLHNFRIDTLAFDLVNKSFVIIEYKKDRSFSVVDQGFGYLSLMLNNKAEFLLEFNEKNKKTLRKEDVDWSQSKIIFIAPFFTSYQKAAINFKNLPIELWEIKLYESDLMTFEKYEPLASSENIDTIIKEDKTLKRLSKQVGIYDLAYHLKRGSEKTRTIFKSLQEKILDLGEIEERYKKFYIAYQSKGSYINFLSIHFYKAKLEIDILIPDKILSDPKKIVKKPPKSFGWAKNLKRFFVNSDKDIPYAMNLIRQSYDFNLNR